jgi:hypothetical protein
MKTTLLSNTRKLFCNFHIKILVGGQRAIEYLQNDRVGLNSPAPARHFVKTAPLNDAAAV